MLRHLTLTWRRFLVIAACFSAIVFFIYDGNLVPRSGVSASVRDNGVQRLILIVPATSTNINLCRLFISAAVLGYPAPILINWGLHEDADEYVQHLAKVKGVLHFLRTIPPQQQDDLVLMVDGYDAWFQLPPHILIQRYQTLVNKLNEHNSRRFSKKVRRQHDIRDTVIFGPDKLCWPDDPLRLACWAVPDSPLAAQAFGPDTDHGIRDHNRPRWLNSGTIMGTVSDVRAVFADALASIERNYVSSSDQLYFAQLFGEQSYSRRLHELRHSSRMKPWTTSTEEKELLAPPPSPPPHNPDTTTVDSHDTSQPDILSQKEIPKGFDDDKKITEHHIGLDYNSSLFQTVAYYEDYITWINHSQLSTYTLTLAANINHYHHFTLPSDLEAQGPLSVTAESLAPIHGSVHSSASAQAILAALSSPAVHNVSTELGDWSTVPLGVNTITKEIFPVLHFTGKKGYREMWWRRNWFHAFAKSLISRRRAMLALAREGLAAQQGPHGTIEMSPEIVEGAWTANGAWLEWEEICGKWEQSLLA